MNTKLTSYNQSPLHPNLPIFFKQTLEYLFRKISISSILKMVPLLRLILILPIISFCWRFKSELTDFLPYKNQKRNFFLAWKKIFFKNWNYFFFWPTLIFTYQKFLLIWSGISRWSWIWRLFSTTGWFRLWNSVV